MHGTSQKIVAPASAVTLTVREDKSRGKMSEEIARDKDFLGRLERVLTEAGLPGDYHLDAYTMVKGSPHRQGFNVGAPRPNRNCIELIWQPRGNDECYSIALMVPRIHDLFEFHKKLDGSWKTITAREEEEAAAQRRSKKAQDAEVSLATVPLLPSGEEFLRVVLKSATSTGVVSASACVDLLEAAYKCADPKQYLISLIGDGFFVRHNNSDTFLRIAQDWLELLQMDNSTDTVPEASSQPRPVPAAPALTVVPVKADQPAPTIFSTQLRTEPVVAAMVPPTLEIVSVVQQSSPAPVRGFGLAGQLSHLKRLVKEAQQNRERAAELERTIAVHDEVILEETRKRDLAREEHRKLLATLNDPDLAAAERELAEVEAALRE